jgi:hypothetical protein
LFNRTTASCPGGEDGQTTGISGVVLAITTRRLPPAAAEHPQHQPHAGDQGPQRGLKRLFAPTLVGTVYGMNFDHMPELHWQLGYPLSIALMLIVSQTLYMVFKRRRWI